MVSRIGDKPNAVKLNQTQAAVTTSRPAVSPSPVRRAFGNEFSSGRGSALRARALNTTGASSLRSEVRGDGQVNCLERAVALAQPGEKVMLLRDADGVGHAIVLRRDGSVVDPNHPLQPAKNVDAFLAANPRYRPGPTVSDQVLEKLLSIPPGPQRELFISASGLDAVARLKVADAGTASVIGPAIRTTGPGEPPDVTTWPTTGILQMGFKNGVDGQRWSSECRAGPGESGAAIGSFVHDAELTVLESQVSGDWTFYRVEGTGRDGKPLTGWIRGDGLPDRAVQIDPLVTARMEKLGFVPPGVTPTTSEVRNFQLVNGLEPADGAWTQATVDAMWSGKARVSTFVTQLESPLYNPVKSNDGSGTDGDNNCGPASVLMNLAALGLEVLDNGDPQTQIEELREETGIATGKTTGPDALRKAARAQGADVAAVTNMSEVDAALARGEPVVLYGVPNQEAKTWWNSTAFGHIGPTPEAPDADGHHWISVIGRTEGGGYIIQDPLSYNGTIEVTPEQLEVYAVWTTSDGRTPSSFSMSVREREGGV